MNLQIRRQCCTSHKKRVRNQQRRPGRKSACTALQNNPEQSGQKGKQPRCAAPVPTEGRVWSPHKTCTSKTGARQQGSVSSCSLPLCGRSTKTFPHSWMTCLEIDSLSHGIGRFLPCQVGSHMSRLRHLGCSHGQTSRQLELVIINASMLYVGFWVTHLVQLRSSWTVL